MLFAVPLQLLLFPDYPVHTWRPFPVGQMLREKRTARQWLASISAYLDWRAGEPWRSLTDPEQRQDSARWEYLEAARLIHDVQHQPERPLLVRRVTTDSIDTEILRFAGWPRKALVDVLQLVAPELTNRRLLSKLANEKLARMIVERERRSEERRRA